MSASLVGSEMCIRDRHSAAWHRHVLAWLRLSLHMCARYTWWVTRGNPHVSWPEPPSREHPQV
eukprot:14636627-Alexandrium_andersonii.AAC.1